MVEARLLRIKIKDELQTVDTPVFNRNHGLQVHPFFEKTSTPRGLHSIYIKNPAIPETASLKDGGKGNTSEEDIPFEYSLADSFLSVK